MWKFTQLYLFIDDVRDYVLFMFVYYSISFKYSYVLFMFVYYSISFKWIPKILSYKDWYNRKDFLKENKMKLVFLNWPFSSSLKGTSFVKVSQEGEM